MANHAVTPPMVVYKSHEDGSLSTVLVGEETVSIKDLSEGLLEVRMEMAGTMIDLFAGFHLGKELVEAAARGLLFERCKEFP